MNIYTKKGDKGKTSLYDDTRLLKDDARVESYGTIDAWISFMGIAKNYVEDKEIFDILEEIQNKLFTVTTNLATKDVEKIKFFIEEKDIDMYIKYFEKIEKVYNELKIGLENEEVSRGLK